MTIWERIKNAFMITTEKPQPDPLLDKLREKGFHFNTDDDKLWWERTWLVATKNGAEISKEVYTNDDEGKWKVTMYGNDGSVFFEHKINETD